MPPTRPWAPPTPGAGATTVRDALRDVERRLDRVDHELFRVEWSHVTGGASTGLLRRRVERARVLAHPDLLGWCRELRPRAGSPAVRRRLELLERRALDAQLEHPPSLARANERIERRIFSFRPRWKGRRVSLAEVWDRVSRESDPGARREGYYANEPLFAAIEPEMRALVAARNDRARELGFSSYPEARLALDGLSVRALESFLPPLTASAPRLARALRDRSGLSSWFPWDKMYVEWQASNRSGGAFRARDCVAAVREGLREWGLGPRDLAFRFRRWDTPTAGQAVVGALPKDVGVVANPRDGSVYYSVLFHEMGHGIHAAAVRGPSPLFRSLGPPAFSECIGGLFEQITTEETWLGTRPGIARAEARRLRSESYEGQVLRLAELVGEIRTELALYANPERDVTETRRRFLTRTLDFDDHDPVSWVDPYLLSPGFFRHSYLLATCFDAQVLSAGRRAVGGALWPNRRLGPWLKRTWMRPGARDDWVPKVTEVTGVPLGTVAFLRAVRDST